MGAPSAARRLLAFHCLLGLLLAPANTLHLQVSVHGVEEDDGAKVTFSTLLLGGNKTDTSIESLSERTFCSNAVEPFPNIR